MSTSTGEIDAAPDQQPAPASGRRVSSATLVAVAVAALVAGYAVGSLRGPAASPRSGTPLPSPSRFSIPDVDAQGSDIPDLPRYPGSVRVDFGRTVAGGFVVTEIEYLTTDDVQAVHDFYRSVFDRYGWRIGNADFERGDWTFLLLRSRTEVTLELEQRGGVVEVDIELSEPVRRPPPAPGREGGEDGSGGGSAGGGSGGSGGSAGGGGGSGGDDDDGGGNDDDNGGGDDDDDGGDDDGGGDDD